MGKKREMENIALHRNPHFFKVLLGDFASHLKLPPDFLKHVPDESPGNAILVGPNGRRWSVRIKRTSDGVYLSKGWSNFVKYYSLKEREFLVFEYNGKLQFSIQVFDTSACEREDLFDLPIHKKPNIGFDNYVSEELKRNINYIDQENFGTRIGNVKSETGELPVNLDALKYIRKNCRLRAEKSSEAFEAAKSFRSVFPSAIVCMTESKVKTCVMYLPAYFSRRYLPQEKTDMSLRDPNENVWTVAFCPGVRRDRLGAGWIGLVHANNIADGDYCVFELKAPTQMKVHIFRASQVVD